MGDEQFAAYYEAAEHSPHVYFAWALEQVVNQLRSAGARIKYETILPDLPELDRAAIRDGAQEIDVWSPFMPLSELGWLSEVKREGHRPAGNRLYEFNAGRGRAFLGTISAWTTSHGSVDSARASFVVATSEKAGIRALSRYFVARRELCCAPGVVVDLVGRKIDMQPAKWQELFLSDHLAVKMKNEVESFFKSRKSYVQRRIPYRRGMLISAGPGNGKTMACRAVIGSAKVPVVYGCLNFDSLDEDLTCALHAVNQYSPCILILENAEALLAEDISQSIVVSLMDDIFAAEGVFVLASTGTLGRMDATFGRPGRFDSVYRLESPGDAERKKILQKALGAKLSQSALTEASKAMRGMSAAFVQEVGVYACLKSAKSGRLPSANDVKEGIEKTKEQLRQAGSSCRPAGFAE